MPRSRHLGDLVELSGRLPDLVEAAIQVGSLENESGLLANSSASVSALDPGYPMDSVLLSPIDNNRAKLRG